MLYHFLLTIIASILENGVSILNFREIFRSGKIGVEETFYEVEKWKINKTEHVQTSKPQTNTIILFATKG